MNDITSPPQRSLRGAILWSIPPALLLAHCCHRLWNNIHQGCEGHFVFSIDDPYIHLALAENIAHGHYGINLDAPSSPSSSILWPYLLAPFARFNTPLFALLLNLVFAFAAVLLIGFCVASMAKRSSLLDDSVRRMIASCSLVFIASLPGLVFLGMEHTLQVLLSGLAGWGIARALNQERIDLICIIAAVLLPSVRYEGLAVTLALCIALYAQQRRRLAVATLLLSLLPLIGFSLYLHRLGLPLLPASVIVKSGVYQGGKLERLREAFANTFLDGDHLLLTALLLATLFLALTASTRQRRIILLGAAAAEFLHLLIGPFGWFHRYEIAIEFFAILVLLPDLFRANAVSLGAFSLAMLSLAAPGVTYFTRTVAGAESTYRQQYQAHRFITQFAAGNIAVNDLGLVSYHHRPQQEIVDLYGLGSPEAALVRRRDTAWLNAITMRHHVSWVIIYPEWFRGEVPASWRHLGALCLRAPIFSTADACEDYYSTSLVPPADGDKAFAQFAATLPATDVTAFLVHQP